MVQGLAGNRMTAFSKFMNEWRAKIMATQSQELEQPQGSYTVWGYWLPLGLQGQREHVCTQAELDQCITQANGYATETRFAQIVASSGTLVYDTRNPEQRQAERCAVCRLDLDKSATRTEQHGLKFCGVACLIAWEETQDEKEYTVTIKVRAISPQSATGKASDFLNADGEPESVTESGQRRYAVWFRDNDEGNEDHLTALLTDAEAETLTQYLQDLKTREVLSDFVVVLDSPGTLAETLEYITEKLDVEA